ncbi:hypothetical protein EDF51_104354 [Curtobacterium sp. PhB25]|uniref:hypothetical protein n=1 Tax=unclassified Curtobacterium TaxID=257496 RepID=UPI001043AE86|nr:MULTISPECIES: hypothetical protein [unclassified Curtobacterium]TCU81982.1 hypothetical protein EDF48_11421 [Curtobacterium sp. PhB191]TDW39719.1 hypothetical protein EDF52_12045 [Curtobacterium sp. PhB42]TDW50826.1 hypothetical protein EDF47_11545 [Curtobacterium sp. PhB190]TDW72289.1 hypothetical protein EDF51_104354 [Curtobacterium sp. PhB25]
MSTLADLVDAGKIGDAVQQARGLTPGRVRELLFASGGFMRDSGPYDEFFRRWYATLDSPYLRAEAADRFCQAYLTELADVPGAEQFGAALATESKRDVLGHLAKEMRGRNISDWSTSPEEPLSKAQVRAWADASYALASVRLP